MKRILALAAAVLLPVAAQAQTLKCLGKNQAATLKVSTAGAAPPEKGAKANPQCPEGWTLERRSVKKSGAYTCRAAPGTPAVKLACPADLGYFENVKKGLIGCRP